MERDLNEGEREVEEMSGEDSREEMSKELREERYGRVMKHKSVEMYGTS